MLHIPLRFAVVTAAIALLASSVRAEDKPLQAVWKPQKIQFFYQSFTTFYSCDALEDRLEVILRALGAKDVKAVAGGCMSSGPSATPYVTIEAKVPVEATPEALAEINRANSDTKQQLKARVRGERPEEMPAPFPAVWKSVNLSVGQLGLEAGECELIDELKRKVLPKLAVQVVKDEVNCMPHRTNFAQPRLEVQALQAAPTPDEKAPPPSEKG